MAITDALVVRVMTDLDSDLHFQISDAHVVSLFMPFRDEVLRIKHSLEHLPCERLVEGALAPSNGADFLKKAVGDSSKSLWTQKPLKISRDLHSHLGRILALPKKADELDEKKDAALQVLTLADPALRALEGPRPASKDEARRPKGLYLWLGRRAQERAGITGLSHPKVAAAMIRITDAQVHSFTTGLGILCLNLTVMDKDGGLPSAALINEAVVALCHDYNTNLGWYDGEGVPSFTIRKLADCLVKRGKHTAPWPPRLFSYASVLFRRPIDIDEKRLLAQRLARKYSVDYEVNDWAGSEVLEPFDSVVHAVSIEGGATVVGNANGVPFLDNYIDTVVAAAYRPIALIAYHEFVALREFTPQSVFEDDQHRFDEEYLERRLKVLNQLNKNLLHIKLNYRFLHASSITMHNSVHNAWRNVLALDSLLQEVNHQVEIAKSSRGEELLVLAGRRQEIWDVSMVGIMAFLSIFTAGKESLSVLLSLATSMTEHDMDLLSKGVGLICGFAGAAIAVRLTKKKNNVEALTGGRFAETLSKEDLEETVHRTLENSEENRPIRAEAEAR